MITLVIVLTLAGQPSVRWEMTMTSMDACVTLGRWIAGKDEPLFDEAYEVEYGCLEN